MASIGFRIFCTTIAILFFFESAFSTVFIGDTQSSELRENSYGGVFGYQSDVDSGLMSLGHRYYDSSTGRFLSRDPVGYSTNWFNYCSNNPIRYVDPDGNVPVLPLLGLVARGLVWVGSKVLTRAPRIAAPTKALLQFTKENFRQNLMRLQGLASAPVGYIAHHMIPYANTRISGLLQKLGLNVNPHDPKFGTWVPEAAHKLRKLHDQYTSKLIEILEGWAQQGYKPTEKQLIKTTEELSKKIFN